jgi:hypothetical protein
MSYIQKYPLVEALPKIENHERLPPDCLEIGRVVGAPEGREITLTMVKRGRYLSILRSYTTHRDTGDTYSCAQYDYPLNTLSWFPSALAEFQKPPAQGGLHAGAMTSGDSKVDEEMLSIDSLTDGYALTNWSRQSPLGFGVSYEPTSLALNYHFLYGQGLLDLWKSLGDKYERGEL